jgi:hypothetical protein
MSINHKDSPFKLEALMWSLLVLMDNYVSVYPRRKFGTLGHTPLQAISKIV